MLLKPGSKAKKSILLQHGWAFDSSMWDSWVQSNPDIDFVIPDRGYFNSPLAADYDSVEIAVTHSFGLHLLPEELFGRLKALIIISGFQDFHPNTPIERTYSRRIIGRMLKNLRSDAGAVLHRFHTNAFFPEKIKYSVPKTAGYELLYEDLSLLDNNKVDIEQLRMSGKILILQGMKDRIVNNNKAFQLQYSIPGSRVYTHEEGGHMLPFTHEDWCLERIQHFLDNSGK